MDKDEVVQVLKGQFDFPVAGRVPIPDHLKHLWNPNADFNSLGICAVLGKRRLKKVTEYLIWWADASAKESTWESM